MSWKPFTIIHVPHSSMEIPEDLLEDFLLSREELTRELHLMTDHYTGELFNIPGVPMIRFPVSRLVVDPERFLDDSQEIMATKGMGAVYTSTSNGRPLRVLDESKRKALLNRYYRPHHLQFDMACTRCLHESGKCLLIDGHSFPSIPLPYELDQISDRPNICIGTDEFHTPAWLSDIAERSFREYGFVVSLNAPFSGTLVPSGYYRREARVMSIMIEINRSLYMKEPYGSKNGRFVAVRLAIQKVMSILIDAVASR